MSFPLSYILKALQNVDKEPREHNLNYQADAEAKRPGEILYH